MSRTTMDTLHLRGPLTIDVTNGTGGALAIGDVVVLSTAADTTVVTTTSAAETRGVGVVAEAIANGAVGKVAIQGYVGLVNVTASVTRGRYLETSTTVKKATENTTRHAGSFGQITKGGTTPSAYLFGIPDLGTGGGGGGGSMTVEQTGGSPSTASVTVIEVGSYTDNGGGDVTLFPNITGTGDGQFVLDTTETDLYSPDNWNTGDGGALFLTATDFNALANHGTGNLAREGFHVQVGSAPVGLFISEKNSTTLQVYMDDSGGTQFDVLFEEQSDSRHFQFKAAAGGIAEPAMGMLPVYAAAPHSGTETEGEMYYDSTLHKARCWNGSSWNNLF